jgi:trigger factor
VFAALLDSHEFEIPKILVEEEIDRGVSAFQNHAQQQRFPIDQPMDREQYREEAERRVRLALVMREVVSDQAIKADDSEIRSRIEKLAQSYDDPKQVIDWHYSDPARLRQFEGVVVEELLLEHLLAEAKIVEKKVTLQQLMNINSSNVIDTVSEQDQEA